MTPHAGSLDPRPEAANATLRPHLPDAAASHPLEEFEAEALPHLNDMFRTASRLLRDHGKAGDAVQETYLIAWKNFQRYERGTNCRAWLFQILFNVVRHERRSWYKWITGGEEDLAEAQLAAPEQVPDSLTDGEILAALDGLPAPFREVLLLVDIEEFAYKEACEILKVPIGTVMSRLSRGRALLRAGLADVARSYGIGNTGKSPGMSGSPSGIIRLE